jgi:hypothetical protein
MGIGIGIKKEGNEYIQEVEIDQNSQKDNARLCISQAVKTLKYTKPLHSGQGFCISD